MKVLKFHITRLLYIYILTHRYTRRCSGEKWYRLYYKRTYFPLTAMIYGTKSSPSIASDSNQYVGERNTVVWQLVIPPKEKWLMNKALLYRDFPLGIPRIWIFPTRRKHFQFKQWSRICCLNFVGCCEHSKYNRIPSIFISLDL